MNDGAHTFREKMNAVGQAVSVDVHCHVRFHGLRDDQSHRSRHFAIHVQPVHPSVPLRDKERQGVGNRVRACICVSNDA